MNNKAESSGLYIFTATQVLFMGKILLELGEISFNAVIHILKFL